MVCSQILLRVLQRVLAFSMKRISQLANMVRLRREGCGFVKVLDWPGPVDMNGWKCDP